MTVFNGLNGVSIADAPGGVLSGFVSFFGFPNLAQLQDAIADTINGNGGNDRIFAGNAGDTINGGDGNDVISGMFGLDVMDGGAGIDTHDVTFFGGNYVWNMISGLTNFAGETAINFENARLGAGNDTITGTNGANTIDVGAGNDRLIGNGGNDTLVGNLGNDSLEGGSGIDAMFGGIGNDVLLGGLSQDNVFGDDGNDIIRVLDGEFADNANGGFGTDLLDLSAIVTFNRFATVDLTANTYGLNGFGPGNTIFLVENVYGTQLGDSIRGNGLNNLIRGLGGNDTVQGEAGNDSISGGDGNDVLIGGLGNDVMDGGNGVDNVQGLAGNDNLNGGNDNDVVNGGFDNDRVNGGFGNDTLFGGPGFDNFLFNTALNAALNVDFMPDFFHPTDTIQLESAIFTALPAVFGPGNFTIGPPMDADDYINYFPAGGQLVYDSNGNGAGGATLFARVVPGTFIDWTDFVVV